MRVVLVLPHQLYDPHPLLTGCREAAWLVEDPLLFRQYAFHAHKLVLHVASMDRYAARLERAGVAVTLVRHDELADFHYQTLARRLSDAGVTEVALLDPHDDWIERRLTAALADAGIGLAVSDTPGFLTPCALVPELLGSGRPRMARFYERQRRRLGILIEPDGTPVGGRFSFDAENRKRLPRGHVPPAVRLPPRTPEIEAAVRRAVKRVAAEFPGNPGAPQSFALPVTHAEAADWLSAFVDERLPLFGPYEDAISRDHPWLYHSILTPMLNVGLLTPRQVVDAALGRADVPIASLEGFIRQVIGWREFMRATYELLGRTMRTTNALGHANPMPRAFYDASTGIPMLDDTIRRVIESGYAHHIERLMVLGNVMLLLEIHPDAVYRWFMELFVDAYDWVMVPNVYGMSQYADGGLITTKPYVSGSNYLRKMSDWPAGDRTPDGPWTDEWDGLYWGFVGAHRDLFRRNPRMAAVSRSLDTMSPDRRARLERAAAALRRRVGLG